MDNHNLEADMNNFLTEIIVKMKPAKPKSPSDLEVINEMLSDKFITLHKALIKQGALIMASQQALEAAIEAEKLEVLAAIESIRNQANPDWDGLIAKVKGIYVAPVAETPVDPTEEPLPAE